jgi:hypothetical protein
MWIDSEEEEYFETLPGLPLKHDYFLQTFFNKYVAVSLLANFRLQRIH